MHYYPVYLNLRERAAVVIGGGSIGTEKLAGLVDAGARVALISPEATERAADLAATGKIVWHRREYERGDLDGTFIAYSATNNPEVNAAVFAEAEERGIPLCSVDDVENCSFIGASVMRRGDLAITVSTSGNAPALAVRLRERLEAELGEEYASFLALAGKLRQPLAERHPALSTRRDIWYRLVDSDIFELLRSGEQSAAEDRIEEITGVSLSHANGHTR